MKFASIVVLSFNRPRYLADSITSLHSHTLFPYELIVVDDGSIDYDTIKVIQTYMKRGDGVHPYPWISTAIFNCGKNIGLGAGINRGFNVARGDYLLKMDADLRYKEGWLTEATELLDTFPEVGMLGLFHYHHDPCDHEKEFIEYRNWEGKTIEIVNDFVGSCMVMRREVYEKNGLFREDKVFSEDVAYKEMLQDRGYLLGLPVEDKVVNIGFGEQHSSLIRTIGKIGDAGSHEYWKPTPQRLIFVQGKPIPYKEEA